MKKIVASLSFLLLTGISFSQHNFSYDGIKISTKTEKCTDPNSRDNGYVYEVFTVTNTTNSPKVITYHIDAYYDGNCRTCENNEYTYSVSLKPNETIVGTVKDKRKGLAIFSQDDTGMITDKMSDLKLSFVSVK
ncbi:MAG: hypothetical protein RL264_2457 [Bacteroidota bacterium]|jgi:hypothetical protein